MDNIYNKINTIGADEVGISEYLSPIIVCAVYLDSKDIIKIKSLNLKDSKLLSLKELIFLGNYLISNTKYSCKILHNKDFNKIKNNNLNFIKSKLFNNAIYDLIINNYDEIIIDGYTTYDKFYKHIKNEKNKIPNVKLIPKSDNHVLSVICASIIAKYIQYIELEKLSITLNRTVPLNHHKAIDFAYYQIKSGNISFLDNYAKKSYNTTKYVMQRLYDNDIL